jgi:hypothetical protein
VKEVKKATLVGFGLVTVSVVFLFATLIIGTPEPSFVVQMNLLVALLVYLFALSYVLFKLRQPASPRGVDQQAEALEIDRAPTTQNLLKERAIPDYIDPQSSFFRTRPKEPVGNSITEDTTDLLKED